MAPRIARSDWLEEEVGGRVRRAAARHLLTWMDMALSPLGPLSPAVAVPPPHTAPCLACSAHLALHASPRSSRLPGGQPGARGAAHAGGGVQAAHGRAVRALPLGDGRRQARQDQPRGRRARGVGHAAGGDEAARRHRRRGSAPGGYAPPRPFGPPPHGTPSVFAPPLWAPLLSSPLLTPRLVHLFLLLLHQLHLLLPILLLLLFIPLLLLVQANVRTTLEMLRDANVKIWMLTGDKLETARVIAQVVSPPPPALAPGPTHTRNHDCECRPPILSLHPPIRADRASACVAWHRRRRMRRSSSATSPSTRCASARPPRRVSSSTDTRRARSTRRASVRRNDAPRPFDHTYI